MTRCPARSWRRWLIDILLIAGGVISLIVEPLSIAIHSVVGLVFVGTVGPHLWHRRRWIAGALTRLRRRITRRDPPMQMNVYDLNRVLYLAQEAGVRQAGLRFTDHAGHLGVMLFLRRE